MRQFCLLQVFLILGASLIVGLWLWFFGAEGVEDKIDSARENDATVLDLRWERSRTRITDIPPLKGLTNLKQLYLQNHLISDLTPLADLTNLEELVLYMNEITDLSPLSGLTNLKKLRLSGNEITDLTPLTGLTKLESLNLNTNKITDISPLKGLTNLKYLSLLGNPLPPYEPNDQRAMLKKALPNCEIRYPTTFRHPHRPAAMKRLPRPED